MHLEASDPSFIDAFLPSNAGRNDRLDRIDRLIDWPKVAAILDGVHAAPEGRPAYRPITMVKIIVLQQWYDASDVGMEEALQDRLSFRRFTELTLTDAVPDHSTISRFRKKIAERGLARMLFADALPAVGGEGHAGEARNADRRDDHRGAGAASAVGGGGAERDGPQRGVDEEGEAGRISAAGCTLGWTRGRG